MSADHKRLPPQSIEAEKAVLGCILINNDSISDILEYLSPDSFYENKHRIIFNSINMHIMYFSTYLRHTNIHNCT